MIRELHIARSIQAHYVGQPEIKFYADGVLKKTITSPPSHSNYRTRTFTLPEAIVGHIFHVTSSLSTETTMNIVTEPLSSFTDQILWHYYEVTHTGSVNVSLYLDDTLKVGDGDDADSATIKKNLTTTASQNTVKVYLPTMSYGRVPHVKSDITDTGQIVRWNPVSLPLRFYKKFGGVREWQITYNGIVFVDLFIDGQKIGDTYQFDQKFNDSGAATYGTETFMMPENSGGRIFQYVQVAGDGDIVSFETDAHPIDPEPAVVEGESPIQQ